MPATATVLRLSSPLIIPTQPPKSPKEVSLYCASNYTGQPQTLKLYDSMGGYSPPTKLSLQLDRSGPAPCLGSVVKVETNKQTTWMKRR